MLRLFVSMGRKVKLFVPHDSGNARACVCRPIVHSIAQISKARPAVVGARTAYLDQGSPSEYGDCGCFDWKL